MLSVVGAVAGNAISVIPGIWEKIENVWLAHINKKGIIYAYDYEVTQKLELLQSINIEALAKIKIDSPVFCGLVNNLETAVGASILFGFDRRKYRTLLRLLRKYWKQCEQPKIEQEDEKTEEETVTSILEAMSFTILKIENLKRLTLFAKSDDPLFPAYRLKIRIENIKRCLITMKKCLAQIKRKEDRWLAPFWEQVFITILHH
jgi:hypothetical protein